MQFQNNIFILFRERHKKTWVSPIPESYKLKDPEITDFVDSMKMVVFMAMFSKVGSHDSAVAIDQLAQLRPERIIPPLLEKSVCVFNSCDKAKHIY